MQQLIYDSDSEFIKKFMRQEQIETKVMEVFLSRFLYAYKRNRSNITLKNVEIEN